MKFDKILLLMLLPLSVQAEEVVRPDTLNSVVVTGTRNATDSRHLTQTITSIGHEKLTEQYQLNVLSTVMQQTPGLFVTSRSIMGYGISTGAAGGIKVRGVGSGAELLVLIDGQPQYAGLMGHPIADAYQSMMAERVEVLRGPASLLYGSNAMGGVMNIVTRQMKENGQRSNINLGAGSYGTVQAEIMNQYRLGKFTSNIGVNYQRTDGHRANCGFDQVNEFAKLGYELTPHWRLGGDIETTHYNSSNPGTVTSPMIDNDMHITRGLASLNINNEYEHTSGSLRGYFDWGYHKINDGHTADAAEKTYLYKHRDFIGGLTWYQSASFFQGNRITVGLDWQHFGGKAWNDPIEEGKDNTWLTTNSKGGHLLTQDEVGAYIDFRQDIWRWLSLDAGIRYDWHNQAGSEWIPQGGLSFHVCKDGDLKAIVSRGFRNPTIKELYLFKSANKDLEPERMMNYELSYSHRVMQGRGHVSANLFLIKGDNLINTIYSQEEGHMLNVNTGAFTHHGFEVAGDFLINKHWTVDANYSYLHMRKAVIGAPESKLYVGTHYTYRKFALILGLQNISGLYLSESEKENYTLLNVTASYQFIKQLRVWVRGENLMAERYQTMLGFPMPKATVMAGVNIDI